MKAAAGADDGEGDLNQAIKRHVSTADSAGNRSKLPKLLCHGGHDPFEMSARRPLQSEARLLAFPTCLPGNRPAWLRATPAIRAVLVSPQRTRKGQQTMKPPCVPLHWGNPYRTAQHRTNFCSSRELRRPTRDCAGHQLGKCAVSRCTRLPVRHGNILANAVADLVKPCDDDCEQRGWAANRAVAWVHLGEPPRSSYGLPQIPA